MRVVPGRNVVSAGTTLREPPRMVNTTRDGLSVQDARYDNGVYSVTYVSPDLVEEVRIIVAPADAETGRGAGQVQMATRSGTNQFRPAREAPPIAKPSPDGPIEEPMIF
jgi:hypothetical protein